MAPSRQQSKGHQPADPLITDQSSSKGTDSKRISKERGSKTSSKRTGSKDRSSSKEHSNSKDHSSNSKDHSNSKDRASSKSNSKGRSASGSKEGRKGKRQAPTTSDQSRPEKTVIDQDSVSDPWLPRQLPNTPYVHWLQRVVARRPVPWEISIDFRRQDSSDDALAVLCDVLPAEVTFVEIEIPPDAEPTDDGIIALANGLHRVSGLTRFFLRCSMCNSVTDSAIEALAAAFGTIPNLVEIGLDVSLCGAIGDASLLAIGNLLKDRSKLSEEVRSRPPSSSRSRPPSARGTQRKVAQPQPTAMQSKHQLEVPQQRLRRPESAGQRSGVASEETTSKVYEEPQFIRLDLNFHACPNLTDPAIETFAESLLTTTCLRFLHFGFGDQPSTVTSQGLRILLGNLISMSVLEEVYMCFRGTPEFSEACFYSLCASLQRKAELRVFSLSCHGCHAIGPGGLPIIKDMFAKSKQLEQLSLDFTLCRRLTDRSVQDLCEWIQALPALRSVVLRLGGTQVTVDGLSVFKKALKQVSFEPYMLIREATYTGATVKFI